MHFIFVHFPSQQKTKGSLLNPLTGINLQTVVSDICKEGGLHWFGSNQLLFTCVRSYSSLSCWCRRATYVRGNWTKIRCNTKLSVNNINAEKKREIIQGKKDSDSGSKIRKYTDDHYMWLQMLLSIKTEYCICILRKRNLFKNL